ncbi:MAG: hypothetical protein ACLPKW_07135, partial [Acetobacteraceae bacterium]
LTAPNLNVYSKHLTVSGAEELAYQAELAPIVWARMENGAFAGWTYRRTSQFATEDPKFVGGHRHALGSGRIVESLIVGPTPDQTSDTMIAVTNDPTTGIRHVEMMTPLIEPDAELTDAWFVDDSVTPSGLLVATVNGVAGVWFYGLWHLNGFTVSVVCGGLDCGDHAVSNGAVFVPWQSDPGKMFTLAYLQSLNGGDYGDLAVPLDNTAVVTPNTNTTPQTLQEWTFPQTNVTGNEGGKIIVDWPNSRAFILGSNGIRVINSTTGTEINDATYAQIGVGSPDATGPNTVWDWSYGSDGNLYFQEGTQNTGPIIKVNANTLAYVSSFGTDSSSLTPSSSGIPKSNSIQTCFAGGTNYLVCACDISAFTKGIAAIDTDTMTYVALSGSYFNGVLEQGLELCAGHQGSDFGTIYGVGQPAGDEVSLTSTHLYEVSLPAGTVAIIGSLTPQQIDPTWIHITTIVGPALDQSDGNLLIGVSTSDVGVPQPAYMLKISIADMSILWKIPVAWLPDNPGMNNSRIIGGVYSYMGGGSSTRPVYVINTITGTVVSFNVFNVQPTGSQVSDSVSGSIILECSFTQAGGSPAPAPGSPTSWSNMWARLIAGGIFFGTTTSTTRYTIPAVIGFTYTTQGQIVRPAVPQEAGAANGPAQGKTRRSHMFSALLAGAVTGTLSIGTSFDSLRPLNFLSPGGKPYDTLTLYAGVFWDTIEDDYSFDGMLCWQITRPLPAPVVSIGGFLNTQDR